MFFDFNAGEATKKVYTICIIYIYIHHITWYMFGFGVFDVRKNDLGIYWAMFFPDLDMSKKLEFFWAPDFKLTWDFNWIGT